MAKPAAVRPWSFGWREWLGAAGDAGTLVPIFLSLAALNGLEPRRALLITAAAYLVSAAVFRLPVPIQPLKAMAAIAVARGLGMGAISAAAIQVGLILVALAASGRLESVQRFFTRPIVKGIQLGVGLMLAKSGLLLLGASWSERAATASVELSWWGAFWLLALPQIPLTLGNSVFAAADAARSYFGPAAARATPRNLALSVGCWNLLAGLAGGLPLCHGSGGFTAHARFGARGPGATTIAGGALLAVALFCGQGAREGLAAIPPWVLGLMLVYVGACHARLIEELEDKRLALMMGLIGLATSNLAYALAFGLAVPALLGRCGLDITHRGVRR